MKTTLTSIFLFTLIVSCSKNVNYTPEHINETTGRYLFNQDEVIQVFYENNDLFINWKNGKMKPVVLDENTFFVPDIYQKLRFVKHPKTKELFLGIVSEDNENKVEYAYKKVADDFKTPRMYWRDKEYQKASDGYVAFKQQDSTQNAIDEYEVNKVGYRLLGNKDFDNAIIVLEMNVSLFPERANVYDSLGDAYLRKGDSLQAFNNFKKSLQLNSENQRAQDFVKNFGGDKPIPDL